MTTLTHVTRPPDPPRAPEPRGFPLEAEPEAGFDAIVGEHLSRPCDEHATNRQGGDDKLEDARGEPTVPVDPPPVVARLRTPGSFPVAVESRGDAGSAAMPPDMDLTRSPAAARCLPPVSAATPDRASTPAGATPAAPSEVHGDLPFAPTRDSATAWTRTAARGPIDGGESDPASRPGNPSTAASLERDLETRIARMMSELQRDATGSALEPSGPTASRAETTGDAPSPSLALDAGRPTSASRAASEPVPRARPAAVASLVVDLGDDRAEPGRIDARLRGCEMELRLDLDGEPVTLHLRDDGRDVHLRAIVSSASLRDTLEAGVARLREALEEKGVHLGSMSLYADDDAAAGQHTRDEPDVPEGAPPGTTTTVQTRQALRRIIALA